MDGNTPNKQANTRCRNLLFIRRQFRTPLLPRQSVMGTKNAIPSFAKEGWTRPKENAAKHPLKEADGVVVSGYRLSIPNGLIIGGLKQLPRLRRYGTRPFALWRSHPSFAK